MPRLVGCQEENSPSPSMLNLNLTQLIDDAKCYEVVRQMRWKTGVDCPKCHSSSVIKRGKDESQPHRQRYQCKDCGVHFDDLSDPIFALASSAVTDVDTLFVPDGVEQSRTSRLLKS